MRNSLHLGRVAVRRYTGRMETNPELRQIAKRIRARAEQEERDRARQRQLIREAIAAGSTWSQVQAQAQVSRPTVRNALARTD